MNNDSRPVDPPGYLPRVVDPEIQELLRIYGAVEITGTKWCGKTWTARHHGSSIIYLDVANNRQRAEAAPESILQGLSPRVIDEWQTVASLWDTVRHSVDERSPQRGLYILTGSSTPPHDINRHTGVGRIGRVHMMPMTLYESERPSFTVSLTGLFAGEFSPGYNPMNLQTMTNLICRGGWPGTIGFDADSALRISRDNVEATLTISAPAHGKDTGTARRLLTSISRNLGQAVTHKTLLTDMYGAEDNPEDYVTAASIASYLDFLSSMFVLLPISGWMPPARSPKRFRTKPRYYLTDPSLAVAILGMNATALIEDFQTLGLLFENLVIRDLSVFARALPHSTPNPVHYYHDDSGLEVDAIIETADGAWAACEIKLGENKVDTAAANLLRFEKKVTSNANARVKAPSFLAVIVGLGDTAYRRNDGVYVIPIHCLAP